METQTRRPARTAIENFTNVTAIRIMSVPMVSGINRFAKNPVFILIARLRHALLLTELNALINKQNINL